MSNAIAESLGSWKYPAVTTRADSYIWMGQIKRDWTYVKLRPNSPTAIGWYTDGKKYYWQCKDKNSLTWTGGIGGGNDTREIFLRTDGYKLLVSFVKKGGRWVLSYDSGSGAQAYGSMRCRIKRA